MRHLLILTAFLFISALGVAQEPTTVKGAVYSTQPFRRIRNKSSGK